MNTKKCWLTNQWQINHVTFNVEQKIIQKTYRCKLISYVCIFIFLYKYILVLVVVVVVVSLKHPVSVQSISNLPRNVCVNWCDCKYWSDSFRMSLVRTSVVQSSKNKISRIFFCATLRRPASIFSSSAVTSSPSSCSDCRTGGGTGWGGWWWCCAAADDDDVDGRRCCLAVCGLWCSCCWCCCALHAPCW